MGSWKDITFENKATSYFINPPGDMPDGIYTYYFVGDDVVIEGLNNTIYKTTDIWRLKNKRFPFPLSLSVDFSKINWLPVIVAVIIATYLLLKK